MPARQGEMTEVTRILGQIQQGDRLAAGELLPLVYAELRRLAAQKMNYQQPGQTLQPTALVHEAYLRLVGDTATQWDSRGHFFSAAAEAMRRILIENARRRRTLKRGGELGRSEFTADVAWIEVENADELLDLDAALSKLEAEEPKLAKLVELRYFSALSVEETAKAMGTSTRTVKRNWAYAKAWLGREMNRGRQ